MHQNFHDVSKLEEILICTSELNCLYDFNYMTISCLCFEANLLGSDGMQLSVQAVLIIGSLLQYTLL